MPPEDEANIKCGVEHSLVYLLHESLKSENKVAFVQITSNQFGIVYACSDAKLKANLVLSILPEGYDSVPWLGDFRQLTVDSSMVYEKSLFPVHNDKGHKRSYAQPTVTWTRPTGLQTDVQKLLRSAKKLPDKAQVSVVSHLYFVVQ